MRGADSRRTGSYRDRFLKANPGPEWRCRYCGRKLDRAHMTVDHIVPLGALSRGNPVARLALRGIGAEDPDDLANLAASCQRCNSSKGMRVGLWTLRGIYGDRPWFRPALVIVELVIVAAVIAIVWSVSSEIPSLLRRLVEYIATDFDLSRLKAVVPC